ncbi:MAG: AsmA family protein [Rhodospirillales bacterium]|nr:AsmA family protein [Rhodospirillales bacterium]
MVLLDEKPKKKELTPRQKRFRLWARIVLTVAFLFGLSLWVLSVIGSDNPALKEGLEKYLTGATGMEARIGKLNYMGFFPDLELDVEDVDFLNKEKGTAEIKIDSLLFSMRFWDMFVSRQRYETIEIKGARLAPGIMTAKGITLDFMGLRMQGEGDNARPVFDFNGRYGNDEQKINGRFNVEKQGVFYVLPETGSAFDLALGDLDIKGHLSGQDGLKISIDQLSGAGTGENPPLTGDVTLRQFAGTTSAEGQLQYAASKLAYDLDFDDDETSGTVTADPLALEDISPLIALYEQIAVFLPGSDASGLSFAENNIDMDIAIKNLTGNGQTLGNIDIPLAVKKNKMTAGPLKGKLSGGHPAGRITLTGSSGEETPAKLDIDVEMPEWAYGDVLAAYKGVSDVTGNADIHARLQASGYSSEELIGALAGEIVMIAGEGEMKSRALNIWGRGLVNSILPDLDPEAETQLNCVIADFKVENGVAEASPFFMDTGRLTLMGTGTVNLTDQTIDMKLKPKPKQAALLDIAQPVRISGPLTEPDIAPDTLALGLKLGELFLGTINPAFLAYTLTDLGLTDKHPCRPFLEGDEAASDTDQADQPEENAPAAESAPAEENADTPTGSTLNE